MNSSLLVPALIVVAVTAGVFVFGEGLFSSGSSEDISKYSARKSTRVKAAEPDLGVSSSASAGSEFSWDDDTTEQSPVQRSSESFVSTKQTEEAPGALYGSEFDSQTDRSFDAAEELAATDFGSSDNSTDADLGDFAPGADVNTASKQADDDLSDFFDNAPKAADSETSTARASIPQSTQPSTATTAKTVDSSNLDVAAATPKSNLQDIDAFDDFGPAPSDFDPAPRAKRDDDVQSVFMTKADKPGAKKSDVVTSDTDADEVISGALEPVKDSNSSAASNLASGVSSAAPVRKFKITNPKETTLPVTLNVDGKQVTLKPDQSFVIQQSDGDVEVTFSRGGSFGFETKTLKSGFYRFTVSREAGWKLIN